MMKSSHCCLAMLGSIGCLSIANLPAQAIPEAQVIAKLQNIPVYIITDENGTIVEARSNVRSGNPQSAQVSTGVFVSSQDAQNFVNKNLKPQQPDLSKVVKVIQVSLGEIYRRQQENQNKPQELNYVFVPTTQEANSALTILNREGQKLSQFNGLPVFIAIVKAKSGRDEYVTFQRNRQAIVPIFFSEKTLQSTVKKVYPNLASKFNIRVVEIRDLFNYMTTNNDPVINSFEFNPNMDGR